MQQSKKKEQTSNKREHKQIGDPIDEVVEEQKVLEAKPRVSVLMGLSQDVVNWEKQDVLLSFSGELQINVKTIPDSQNEVVIAEESLIQIERNDLTEEQCLQKAVQTHQLIRLSREKTAQLLILLGVIETPQAEVKPVVKQVEKKPVKKIVAKAPVKGGKKSVSRPTTSSRNSRTH